jgi:uncharacterized membrane protein YbhN (UPF0104 family)
VRWAAIARALGMAAPTRRLVLMYARGVTTNILLPGATLSGDLLRSYQLSGLGNPFPRSALSVVFDRLSGLWVLCVLSLAAAAAAWVQQPPALPPGAGWYALALVGLVVTPFVPWPAAALRRMPSVLLQRASDRVDAARERLRIARPALFRSIWLSVAVQVLSAGTLWICGLSVGLQMTYVTMLAAAAPVFIMAALPLGVAGFGTRELAAVLVLGFVGIPAEQATATSLLYGLCAVVQGVLAAPLFAVKT